MISHGQNDRCFCIPIQKNSKQMRPSVEFKELNAYLKSFPQLT